jgi:hypothetical protein
MIETEKQFLRSIAICQIQRQTIFFCGMVARSVAIINSIKTRADGNSGING